MRPADQPLQREDLLVRLVLVGLRRRHDTLIFLDVDLADCLPARTAALRQAPPGVRRPTQDGLGPQEEGEAFRETVSESRWRVRAEAAGTQHQHGDGHRVRHSAVGQLQGQADDAGQWRYDD